MEVMGRPERHDLRLRQAHQREITNQVKKFVAHGLIGKAQRWIDPLIAVTHQGVIERPTLNQPGFPKLLHLVFEAKGARWGDLPNKRLRAQHQAEQLTADGGLRKFDRCTQQQICLLYTSPSPRDKRQSRMPSSA